MYDTYRGLTKILWGFVVVLLDINIEYVSIIPDFIGYGMIAYGLSQLQLEKERNFAIFIGVLALPAFVVPNPNMLNMQFHDNVMATWYHSALGILHFVLMVLIILKLIKMAEEKGLYSIGKRTSNRLRIYVISNLVILTAIPFGLNFAETLGMFLIMLVIFVFIMEIVMIVSIAQFRRVI
ncbi:hypothetical protein FIU87_13630 [Bacillus sp. THAF10]|uniref:hypothetical protein n=1 Tax=Bacillus sp. THAF10 TaxID=2587848 RepID=UPI0012681695|nr:hypothetical protein [Bacillus sp. THAF10]QFT89697.1 hypothetical protein FIU87_13630 [Bacillus sp. THAF10]